MVDVVPTTRAQAMRIAAVITGTLVAFNTMFYFVSNLWFEGGHQTADLASIRVAFGLLTLIVAIASFGAALAPRIIGHALAFLLAAASLVAGCAALAKGLPYVMGGTLLIVGVVLPVLAFFSLQHSRASWSVVIAILITFALVCFFGAPKVRGILGIGIWTALILPGLQVIAVIALAMVRGEYRDHFVGGGTGGG